MPRVHRNGDMNEEWKGLERPDIVAREPGREKETVCLGKQTGDLRSDPGLNLDPDGVLPLRPNHYLADEEARSNPLERLALNRTEEHKFALRSEFSTDAACAVTTRAIVVHSVRDNVLKKRSRAARRHAQRNDEHDRDDEVRERGR